MFKVFIFFGGNHKGHHKTTTILGQHQH